MSIPDIISGEEVEEWILHNFNFPDVITSGKLTPTTSEVVIIRQWHEMILKPSDWCGRFLFNHLTD
jgi:hypothetical protein